MRYRRRSDKNKALANAKYDVMTEMGSSYIQLFSNLIVFNRSSIRLRGFKMRIVKIESFFARYVKDCHDEVFSSLGSLAHWLLMLILRANSKFGEFRTVSFLDKSGARSRRSNKGS